ncbi:MAG: DNA polymerase III subunit delta [Thermodesulfobacteriota bacterium]
MKRDTDKKTSNVCLIRGGQALLVERFVERETSAFLGDAGGEPAVFYADETPVAEALGNASNLSMFADRKAVVLKRVETADKKSLEIISQYCAAPPPHTLLILVSGDASKPDVKIFEGADITIKDAGSDTKKVYERAVEEARRMGLELSVAAAKHLCELTGDDLLVVESELAILAEIHGSGARVEAGEIDAMLKQRKTRGAFDLTGAIADGRKDDALAILAEISAQNQIEPLLLFSSVASRMRSVVRASAEVASSRGSSPEQQKKLIAKQLKVKPGMAHFLWKQSRNFPRADAERVVKILAGTDKALKSSRSNGYELLAAMTVSLLAKR